VVASLGLAKQDVADTRAERGETVDTALEGDRTGTQRWARLASFGFLMAALAPIMFIIAGFIWDLGDDGPMFFIIAAAVALLGAFLVRRFGTWSKIVGIVLAILVGGALFWTAFGLASPMSFLDFVPGLLVPPGVLIALVGCIAALVARNKPAPAEGEGKTIRIVTLIVGLLAVLSAVLTFTSKNTASEADANQASATVVLKSFEYENPSYDLEPGSKVLVKNEDPLLHTFTIEELDVDVAIGPGSEELVEIPGDASGEYVVFCRPHTEDPESPGEDDMASKVNL
jgi:plastocyanin